MLPNCIDILERDIVVVIEICVKFARDFLAVFVSDSDFFAFMYKKFDIPSLKNKLKIKNIAIDVKELENHKCKKKRSDFAYCVRLGNLSELCFWLIRICFKN